MRYGRLRESKVAQLLLAGLVLYLIQLVLTGSTSFPGAINSTVLAQQAPPAEPSKPKGKEDFPCDPIMVSGITGECAGTGDPTGFAGDAEKAGLAVHPPALELADLPKDRYGLIDWALAIKTDKVKPRDSLDPNEKSTPPFNLDIVIFTKSQSQPDVIFPHFVHTLWLTCTNCHPAIFPMNRKEANKMMTMPKIAAGEFCGRCHNRIAFPLSDCLRCHVKPKDEPPIDTTGEFGFVYTGPVNDKAEPWPKKDPLLALPAAPQTGQASK